MLRQKYQSVTFGQFSKNGLPFKINIVSDHLAEMIFSAPNLYELLKFTEVAASFS